MKAPDNSKLEALLKKQEELKQRIAAEEEKRKRHEGQINNRLRALIASAVVAESTDAKFKESIIAALVKHIEQERDVAFLKELGWWKK